MKVLILTCPTGGGHNACANYIHEELKLNNISSDVVDFYDIVNKHGKKLSKNLYLGSLKGNAKIFKNVYKLGELYDETSLISPVYLVNKLHTKKLFNYIKENNYDVVVATHLFPALTLTAINKKENLIKFVMVVTDYECSPFCDEVKPNYMVIQKGLEERFISKGINKEILYNSGIPVSSKFLKAKNIRNELNIGNENVVLIMLGSMGFGDVRGIVDGLINENNIKVIVVCAGNEKLYNDLKSLNNNKLIVFGFVNNVNDLIYSSDVVLTKPGGLSTTEIASIRKPFIHINPIPGVETYNADFFERNNMSFKSYEVKDIIDTTKKILYDKNIQNEMIKNQEKMINNSSASDLVFLIKKICEK